MIVFRQLLFVLFVSCRINAADIVAATGNPSDVQTALNATSAGDRVLIPAGTYNWSSGVSKTFAANISVIGAGTTATGGGNQTIIVDNMASGSPLMDFTVPATGVFRLSGITIQSGTGAIKDNGTLKLNNGGAVASSAMVRVDHMHFIMTSANNYKIIMITGGVFGVMDHSILDLTDLDGLYFYNGRSGSGEAQGNYEWTQPTDFGGTNYFFIEDNIINGSGSAAVYPTVYPTRVYDSFTASKIVTRFNTLTASCLTETHDTGHAPNDRGCRSQEVYGNSVTSPLAKDPNFDAVTLGNGTAMVWGNSWNQVYKNIYLLKVVRRNTDSGYTQTPPPAGWGYAGTTFSGTGSDWDGGTVNGTDTLLGYPCLDQPGRGKGDLLVGVFPTLKNNTTSSVHWPNQALEPMYFWNNSGNIVSGWGGTTYADETLGRVVSDRDYYKPASGVQTTSSSPFNGSTGCGWGTLARRPVSPSTTGVGYFATDQGSWNTSSSNPYGVQMNGASGILYTWNGSSWITYYTPYTYPHPLQGASGGGGSTSLTNNAIIGAGIKIRNNGRTRIGGSQ